MKTLGIIGGLGPLAGAYFYQRVITLTAAPNDSAHIPIVLISDPAIPSRIKHLTGQGPSPVPNLVAVDKRLIEAGAEVLTIPSTTTSYYHSYVQAEVSVPVISLIDAITDTLSKLSVHMIGVLATTPTRTHQIFEPRLRAADIDVVYPDDATQERAMALISAIKGISSRVGVEHLGEELSQLVSGSWADTADAVLLACTELPVIWDRTTPFLQKNRIVYSATDILAKAVLSITIGGGGRPPST